MANPPADALQGAITHDFQTEGYYIVSGSGTAFIDGTLVNGRKSTNNPDGGPNGLAASKPGPPWKKTRYGFSSPSGSATSRE